VTASDPKQIPAASSTATAVVSAPASTTKVEPLRDAATVLAVVISLFSLWRTSRKEKRERLQSIDDDYWIRSVIGPIALELSGIRFSGRLS
jgi:non-ribosomal peptide synthetase component E (peptide arylation enzyme)